jgi:hypothetical protein
MAARRLLWRRQLAPVAVLLLAFVAVSIAVLPRMQPDGDVRLVSYDFLPGQAIPQLRTKGPIQRGPNGFVVPALSTARASFSLASSAPRKNEHVVLVVTAGGLPGAVTSFAMVDRDGTRHAIGIPTRWRQHEVDVTREVAAGAVRAEVRTVNGTTVGQLLVLQVRADTYPPHAIPRAGRWEVALWVVLATLLALALLRRLRKDALLAVATGLAAFLVWPSIVDAALQQLPSDLFGTAVHAKWIDIDTGLLSGTFGTRSALAVQLMHALTPLTGKGVVAGRTASMLIGILALVAVYALGRRVAGGLGAVTAVTCALIADPFRLSLSTSDSTGTLVLAACLFLLAVHRTMTRPDRAAMLLLGSAGAVAILAEPNWWPGVVAAVALLAVRYSPRGAPTRVALVTALLALVLVSLPSRVSVARQTDGDANGDVVGRITRARNMEFVGRGHGAPPNMAVLQTNPESGPRVGLFEYLLGDHSATTLVGGVLGGAYDGLSAAGERSETGVLGLAAFIVELVGVAFLLLVPRLRMLVLIPAMVAVVLWFLAERAGVPPFLAGTAFWPAMLAGAAALAYAVGQALGRRAAPASIAVRLRSRAASLRPRRRARAQPAKP